MQSAGKEVPDAFGHQSVVRGCDDLLDARRRRADAGRLTSARTPARSTCSSTSRRTCQRTSARGRAARLHADRGVDGGRGLERARRQAPVRGRLSAAAQREQPARLLHAGTRPATSRAAAARPHRSSQMVDKAIASHGIDRSRVYVTGMSAGGAFDRGDARGVSGSVRGGQRHGGPAVQVRDRRSTARGGCQQMTRGSQKTAAAVGRPRARRRLADSRAP